MVLADADRTLKRVLFVLGIAAVAVILILLAIEFNHPTRASSGESAIQLAGIDVSFVGSGANNATASQTCGPCGGTDPVGESFYSSFGVTVPYEFDCTPHTWSITHVSGSSSGGFEISNVSADVTTASEHLPVTVPACQAGQAYNGAMIGYDLHVIDTGPSIQTLYLTVTVDQLS
jgi:hypothetical protein